VGELKLCWYCNQETLEREDTIEHLSRLIEDSALMQALQIIHGQEQGRRRYLEVGGLLHLTEIEAREAMAS